MGNDHTVTKRLRIGLTGGIGSGKSTVAQLLATHGATVIDTDAISRQLTQPGGQAIAPLRELFGSEFIDDTGALDRVRMRNLVFAKPPARQALERILHPLIAQETERQTLAATGGSLVFDVPLLAESSHWRRRVSKVLVIDCDAPTQVERVRARSGWTQETAQSVIAQQASREARRACADAVIFNQGLTRDQLALEVATLAALWGVSASR